MSVRGDKEKAQRRYADARERAEKQETGGGPSAFKMPKGLEIFKFDKADMYKLRILPYEVSDRAVDHRFADSGVLHYEYSYWVHQGLGLEGKARHCCLKETFHKPCPICDYLATLEDRWGADKDTYNSYRPKQRQLFALYNVEDKNKTIKLYESSFFSGAGQMSLGQWIDSMIMANPDKYAGFFHLQDGMNLHISVKQGNPFKGNPTWKITHVEGVEAKDLDDEILDSVPQLDKLPIELSYDELNDIFHQKGGGGSSKAKEPEKVQHKDDDEDDDDRRSTKTSSKARYQDDEDEEKEKEPEKVQSKSTSYEAGDSVVYEEEVYRVKRVASDGTYVIEDDDGMVVRGVNFEELKPNQEKKKTNKQKDEDDDD